MNDIYLHKEVKVSKRNVYIDYLKAITIFLVVVGHCIQFGSGHEVYENQLYFNNFLFRLIYSFHMPMFMIISGYLFYNTAYKYSAKIVLVKKIQSICIPLVLWGTMDFIISIFRMGEFPAILELCKMYIGSIQSGLWFLWALLYSCIITLIIKTFGRDSKWIYTGVIVLFFFVTDSFHLRNTKFLYPFFVLGYFGNKNFFASKAKKALRNIDLSKKIFVSVFLIIFIILLNGYGRNISIYRSSMYIVDFNDAWNIVYASLYRWVTGIIGCGLFAMTIYLIHNLIAGKLQKILIGLSTTSLGVYIINSYANIYLLLPLTSTLTFHPIILLIESIAMSLLCWFISYILQKNRLVNLLMFGGR